MYVNRELLSNKLRQSGCGVGGVSDHIKYLLIPQRNIGVEDIRGHST